MLVLADVLCSWYSTFCEIAGIDPTDHRAALAGLPPIDSISLVPVLRGEVSSSVTAGKRRLSLALGSEPTDGFKNGSTVAGWIAEEEEDDDDDKGGQGGAIFKLILGSWDQSTWVGPHFPNSSTNFEPADFVEHCTIPGKKIGCLL